MAIQENQPVLREVLTVNEVAHYLRVSRVTVWRWCKQGIIPAFQLGHNWRIRREDLMSCLATAQHTMAPAYSASADNTLHQDFGVDRPVLALHTQDRAATEAEDEHEAFSTRLNNLAKKN